jgi:4-methyl-5(b-hydroxyethyl)-thiazole monophosphate biosynthesis
MIKISVPLANGFEEIEALVPVDIWRRAGFEVTMMSISDELIVTGSHQISVLADSLFDEQKISNSDMIFLPGGMPGAKNLDTHKGLQKCILEHHSKHKLFGAICAAPLVLGHNKLLENRRATCFPGFESELYGAKHTANSVEVDDNIITAKGAGVAVEFAFAVVSRFNGEEFSRQLAEKMQIKQN